MTRQKFFSCFLWCAVFSLIWAKKTNAQKLGIHLRGVYASKVSLLSIGASQPLKSVAEHQSVRAGEAATLIISKEFLPGEFILRFDYRENESSAPYPSEKHLFINDQDLEIYANPKFVNNNDSTWFQNGEIENTTFQTFTTENNKRKEKLAVLQAFLLNYDEPTSTVYQQAVKEYEKRRVLYNQWLKEKQQQARETFVSHTFSFQALPPLLWKGSEEERENSLLVHYFDEVALNDPLLTRTADLKQWITGYVNLYGAKATTEALRDSLFTLAGKRAIEKAKTGDPEVYGWMVDYFYNGYESFGITRGIEMLQPYLDDPAFLTKKRQAIATRLQGMKTLQPGTLAPDFTVIDDGRQTVRLYRYTGGHPYKLVLFWSAECGHCQELMQTLYPWYQQQGKEAVDVIAVSVDQSETEVRAWKTATLSLPGWKHLRPEGGINSREAKDYFILSTPFMVLVDSATNKIIGLPQDVAQLASLLNRSH